MNIEFQAENSKLPLLLDHLTALFKTILKSFIKPEVLKRNKIHKICVTDPNNYRSIDEIYLGANVDMELKNNTLLNFAEIKKFKLRALDFYIELCVQIKKRFDFEDPHLIYASNFTPEKVLSGEILSIADCKNLYPILDIDIEEVNSEWQLLPELEAVKSISDKDLIDFWKSVPKIKNGLDKPMFPNLIKIVQFVLCLPHSSAACERAFSE